MSTYPATIRLETKPYKMIKWFTKNYEHEVGALGIGQVKDGDLVIERLVFPNQTVNGAHVHFKPADWAPVITQLSMEEIGKIIFYWHKHPGSSATASQGDEEDTFNVFMPADEKDRKLFGFMQTAQKPGGDGFVYEARIEMRDPLFVTIKNVEVTTDEDNEVEDECLQIIKERITVGYKSARDQPGVHGEDAKTPTFTTTVLPSNVTYSKPNEEVVDADDTVTFMVKRHNGQLVLKVSDFLKDWVVDILESEGVGEHCKDFSQHINDSGTTLFRVNPNKKKLDTLFKYFATIRDDMFAEKSVEAGIEALVNGPQDRLPTDQDIRRGNVGEMMGYYRNHWDMRDPYE